MSRKHSICKNGLYDKVKELLKDFEVYELPGVEPNPKITSVREGVAICREKGIEAKRKRTNESSGEPGKKLAPGLFCTCGNDVFCFDVCYPLDIRYN